MDSDRNNSLWLYNGFLENMEQETLEQQIERILIKKKVARVFDLGCGTGQAMAELKEKFKDKVYVIGMDLIKPEHKLDEVIVGNALEVEFPKDVNLLLCFRAMHEIGNLKKLIPKITGCLAKKGNARTTIRMREPTENGFKFMGKMTQEDEDFVKKINEDLKFDGCWVLAVFAERENAGKKAIVGINFGIGRT